MSPPLIWTTSKQLTVRGYRTTLGALAPTRCALYAELLQLQQGVTDKRGFDPFWLAKSSALHNREGVVTVVLLGNSPRRAAALNSL